MAKISQLHFYSVGIVAANKKLSSKIIEVTPIETLTMLSGELTDNSANLKASATDASGKAYDISIASTVSIKATWLPIGVSNRISAPDVRRGEVVIIYRFADTDEFWWSTLKDDMHLRKLETVVYAFSATTKEDTPIGPDNYYFIEISTHQKLLHIHTSKDNGEPFGYDIQINTGSGFIQIQDDDGNFIKFDSNEQQIIVVNKSLSAVEINKKNINLNCSDTIRMTCDKLITNARTSTTSSTPTTLVNSQITTFSNDVKVNGTLSSSNTANLNISGSDSD